VSDEEEQSAEDAPNELQYGPVAEDTEEQLVLGVKLMIFKGKTEEELANVGIDNVDYIEQLGARLILAAKAMREGWSLVKLHKVGESINIKAEATPSPKPEPKILLN